MQPFGRFIEVVPIEDAEMIFLVLTNYLDWEIDPVEYQKLLDSKQPVVVKDWELWEEGEGSVRWWNGLFIALIERI